MSVSRKSRRPQPRSNPEDDDGDFRCASALARSAAPCPRFFHSQRIADLLARMTAERTAHFARIEQLIHDHQKVVRALEYEMSELYENRLHHMARASQAPARTTREHWETPWWIEATPNGTLSRGGMTLTKTAGPKAWDCDSRGTEGWADGVHEWTVRLDTDGNGVGLGICLGDIDMTDDSQNSNRSFILNCTSGGAYDNGGNKHTCFHGVPAGGLPLGSLVSLHLDLTNGTLTFGLDGVWNDAPTFTELPEDTYYPFFALGVPDKAVSVVRGAQLEELLKQARLRKAAGGWTLQSTPNGTLSQGGMALAKVSLGKGWDCDTRGTEGWQDGVHEWTVRLVTDSNGIGLGVCMGGDINPTDDSQNSHLSFIVNLTTGGAYDNSGNKRPCFKAPSGGFPPETLVSVRLDLVNHTLTFGLNGEWNPSPTFSDLPQDAYFPFFALGVHGKSLAIVRGEALDELLRALELKKAAGGWTIEPTPHATLSNGNMSLCKTAGGKGWDCDTHGSEGWSEGTHTWSVRLDTDGNGVGLGICLGDINPIDDSQNSNLSFILNLTTGGAYDNCGNKHACFSNVRKGGLPAGSVISLHLDMDASTLTFGLNGAWNEAPTFTDLPPDTWYPFFAIGSMQKSLSVVERSDGQQGA